MNAPPKKVKRQEVADLAEVSPSTVSRALNDHPAIPHTTRERVKKIAKELGYVPSQIGKSFNQNKSFRIGLVIPFRQKVNPDDEPEFVSTDYMTKIMYGILVSASKENYHLNIIADHNLSAQDLQALVLSHQVDGLMFPIPKVGDRRFAYLHKNHIPFVFIHHYVKNKPYLYVDCDSRPGMEEAFAYLAQKKITKLGYLSGNINYINSLDRMAIFEDLAKQYGMKVCRIVEGNFLKNSGLKAAKTFLKGKVPEVIFCANDRMAFGLIEGLKNQNISIPQQMRVIGFDDEEIAMQISPHLTTIENPLLDIGELAGKTLLRAINGHSVTSERLTSKLILRETA